MIYSHFYRHNSFCTVFWVSSFYLSVNIVLYQFTVTCIENWSMRSLGQWIIENKVYLLSMLGQKKKVHDCDYVFGSSTKFQRRMNGFVKADICHQVLKCLFTCILRDFICLKTLLRLQFILGLYFTPACVLLSVCSLHFRLSLHFTPGPQSAVRSPQSTFYTNSE